MTDTEHSHYEDMRIIAETVLLKRGESQPVANDTAAALVSAFRKHFHGLKVYFATTNRHDRQLTKAKYREQRKTATRAELCRAYGISQRTAQRWDKQLKQEGQSHKAQGENQPQS